LRVHQELAACRAELARLHAAMKNPSAA
jgi:hypothetical protein